MGSAARFSVLVVDDEKSNLEVLTHLLRPLYTVYVAKSGPEALSKAADVVPDLILLDIIMPEMSGFEVFKQLKIVRATRDIPVIFITGQNSVEDQENGFFLGAVDYITKPFHTSIVKARVNTHLQIVKHIRTIEKLGMVDALTSLPNQLGFDTHITAEWGRAIREMEPLSLLALKVDNFKIYNNIHGHPQGDYLLQALAELFRRILMRSRDMVTRLADENFAIILPNTNQTGAEKIAEEIRDFTAMTKISDRDDGTGTTVTVSIGVTSIKPTLESSIDSFLETAMENLQLAETTGNTVCS